MLLRNTPNDEKKCQCINFMNGFQAKKDQFDNFDYNVKHCLRNEIKSKSIVNNEFGVDSISDAGRTFNFVCTKIMFKNYLEDNNMIVCK